MSLVKLRPALSAVALLTVLPALMRPAAAASYEVGPGRAYWSPCALIAAVALQPGDVIEVDAGSYNEACNINGVSGSAVAPITLRGKPGPRPVLDGSGIDLTGILPAPRALLQWWSSSHWRVEHLEFANAQNGSANGAGIRATAASRNLLFRDVTIHDCQMGAMSDSAADIAIERSDIYRNGIAGSGYAHNLYLQGATVRLVGNYIHDSVAGQNVKLRAHYAEVLYNRIERAGNYEIDCVQGPATGAPNSHCVFLGNLLVRSADADNNSQTIVFGSDGSSDETRNGNLYLIHNTVVLRNASNRLVRVLNPGAGASVMVHNNIIHSSVAGAAVAADPASASLIGGFNNWVSTNVTTADGLARSVVGDDPGFISITDLHLLVTSPAIDRALGSLSYLDGDGVARDATALLQYVYDLDLGDRPGSLDIGAFEYGWHPDGGISGNDGGGGGYNDGGAGNPGPGGEMGSRRDAGVSARANDGGDGSGCSMSAGSAGAGLLGALLLFALACGRRLRQPAHLLRGFAAKKHRQKI